MYNIVCDSLGIEPKSNNGTLRLPLKPIGTHSNQPPAADDVPEDLPSDTDTDNAAPATNNNQEDHVSKPGNQDQNGADSENEVENDDSYWAFIKAKIGEAKAWADDLITKLGGA